MWLVNATLALLLIGASACAQPPGVVTLPQALRVAVVSLAHPTPLVIRGEVILTRDCMRRAGFRYPQGGAQESLRGSIFGLAGQLSVRSARAHGYGAEIQQISGHVSRFDPMTRYLKALTPSRQQRFMSVLQGSPSDYIPVRTWDGRVVDVATGGCVALARDAIYGSPQDFLFVSRFPVYLFRYAQQIEHSPMYHRARSAYAACMTRAGYDVDGPGAAINLALKQFGSTDNRMSAIERAMAVADATCQATSRVFSAWDSVGWALAARWILQHQAQIVALARIQQEASIRARSVVASH